MPTPPRLTPRRTPSRPFLVGAAVASLALLAGGAAIPSDAQLTAAGTTTAARVVAPTASNPRNPLAGRPWGVYKGGSDMAWKPYVNATGTTKTLLGKIALRPKAGWFGKWIINAAIADKVKKYVAISQDGNPDALVQLTVFRMVPWEHKACNRLPTTAEVASYKQWINRFAGALGNAHVALVLQPDGPFAMCVPKNSTVPSRLIAYAAKRFSEQSNTSVYIDGGASDWPAHHPERAAAFLVADGIKYVRGFALNSTHYSTTGANIDYGTQVVAQLAKRGVPGKHFIISTSSNGRGFTFSKARGSDPDNAKTCATKAERVCVTLGIPPTADVDNPKWKLTAARTKAAAKHVDGYLWFGRPWLVRQASPFSTARALNMARTTPF